ncbi:class I SAM-dependent methyltransferase [Nigerium massiliense]|uniref:class I SAM-dependent methyltransferase n=1 Tax=Nigerium massiliense TaxID=1522317 RepID=UPI00058B8DA2|nr:class I SAM-dependent methyltransferase [Nigerium massiliense]
MNSKPLSRWQQTIERNPAHSQWYIERFKAMAAEGRDLVGEARLVDAMVGRGSTILDAGCGPGRHAHYLHERGHTVVGIDLDPALIAAAEADAPGPRYVVGDLYDVVLPDDVPSSYDLVFSAGNVMGFLHPDTRRPVLANIAGWLADDGRAVIGFGAGRGYDFAEFVADARSVGLEPESLFSSWDLRPLQDDSTFLVAVLHRA